MNNLNENIDYDDKANDLKNELDYLNARCSELEKLLTKKNDFIRFITNSVQDVIWKLDKNYKFISVSPNVFIQRGYKSEELVGTFFWDSISASTMKLFRDGGINLFDYNSVLELVGSGPIEVELNCKDGSNVLSEIFIEAIFNEKGEFDGVFGSSRKINRIEFKERYSINEELLKVVVRNADVLIFILDAKGEILLSEGKSLELFKLLPNQITGLSIYDIFEESAQIRDAINKSLTGLNSTAKVFIQNYIFEIKFSPYGIENGRTKGVVAIATDVTERIRDEHERDRLIEELHISRETITQEAGRLVSLNNIILDSEEVLKRNNAEKDKFISIISHDLKSPLGGVMGLAGNMYEYFDEYSDEDFKDSLALVSDAAKGMYKLLENLLLWARLNRGIAEFSPEKIDLYETIKENVSIQQLNAQNKKIKIIISEGFNYFVNADRNLINTVLRNLISNAVKFTKVAGEVVIGATKINSEYIEVYIKDNGVGISNPDLDRLFKLDEHYSNPGTADEKGTGLGLLLCKEMVERTGGRIKIESELGYGTTVTFTLPAFFEN